MTLSQGERQEPASDYTSLPVREPEAARPFIFNSAADLQLPELPTGCEATATSTLMRMNGFYFSKTEVADAMPKSDSDFVNAFLGDPYSRTGNACMAPCAAKTAFSLIGSGWGQFIATSDAQGNATELEDLTLPAIVWVTQDMAEPTPLNTQDGFTLYHMTHCMTVTRVTPEIVEVVDPMEGVTAYPRAIFEKRYRQLGSQSVYFCPM